MNQSEASKPAKVGTITTDNGFPNCIIFGWEKVTSIVQIEIVR